MSCVWMLQRGHSGDGCVLASTLRKGTRLYFVILLKNVETIFDWH